MVRVAYRLRSTACTREARLGSKLIRALIPATMPGWGAQAARTFGVNALGMGLGFALQLVLARALGVVEYGRYVYVITWVTIVSIACLLGYDTASLRFVAEHRARGEDAAARGFMEQAQQYALMLSVALAALLFVLALMADGGAVHAQLRSYAVGALLLPMTVLFHLHGYFLQALKRADEALALQLVMRPLLLISGCIALVVYLRPPDAFRALVLTLAATALVVGLEVWRVRRLAPATSAPVRDETLRRRWRGTARSLFLVTLAHQVLANGDVLVVGLVIGTSDAGVYAVAAKLAAIVSFATSSINFVLAPTIADLHARGRRGELQAAVNTATRAALGYAVPVLAVMLAGGGWLLSRFGPSFEQGYTALILLCLGQAAVAFNGAVGFLLTMTGHQDSALRVVSVTVLLMLVLASIFAHWWGIAGVAAAAAIAQGARGIALGRCVHRHLGLRGSVAA